MSYNDEEVEEEIGFKVSLDNEDGDLGDDPVEPLEGAEDFGLDEEDPDKDH